MQRLWLQLNMTNSAFTYFNYNKLINCTQTNSKLIFALSSTYPDLVVLPVGATGYRMAGKGILPLGVSLAADSSSAGKQRAPCNVPASLDDLMA